MASKVTLPTPEMLVTLDLVIASVAEVIALVESPVALLLALVVSLLLPFVASACNFIEKETLAFFVNFAKFLRTPFLREHLQWLLLTISRILHICISQTQHMLIQFFVFDIFEVL